ncbi:MAG: insulinase family protein [candidate division KSB1 bacterium]|nr:insulinase family protein [candidate division KSB1 bacterium]MDZ7303481.1 insulinase family protein [candidate division KSB1 bacterium]MDZ7312717.1 insulinase family protein [candidate division KSB1 bacterium]
MQKPIDNSEHQKTVLPGGLRIVTERIPHVRSVSLGVWVLTGTRDELPEENGISHFLEHMMFKGTRRRKASDIAESLEAVGGHLNAFTGKELTCYYAHVLDEHLPLAVDVLADMLTDSVFDPEEILKEKSVIIEEINSVEDTPEDWIQDLFMRDLFPQHALGFSTLGTREIISSLRRDQLLDYVQRHYSQNRLLIAAAGNVEHADLVAQVGEHFCVLPANGTRVLVPPPAKSLPSSITDDDCSQTHICIGSQALRFDDPRKFVLLVLNTLLGGGMSSRLFQTIREQHGLAYSVFSFQDFMFDTGVFGVYLGTDPDRAEQAMALLRRELQRLCDEHISPAEHERTINQLKGSLMLGLESTSSRMSRLAKMEIYLGEYVTLDEVCAGIERVTAEQINQLARELFAEDKMTSTIIRPVTQV